MESEKERVGRPHERVVDLEVGELLEPTRAHVVERAGALQTEQAPAMPVGGNEQAVGFGEEHAPRRVQGRQHVLGEEEDILGRQSEVIVLLEEGACGGVVGGRRQDVPGRARSVALGGGEQSARMQLEERTGRHGSDRKHALGRVVAQARRLSARHENEPHAPGGQELGSFLAGASRVRLFFRIALQRKEVGRGERGRAGLGLALGLLEQALDQGQIERRELGFERGARAAFQTVQVLEHMVLPRGA